MRKYFNHAYEGLCNTLQPIAELMLEVAKILLVYITIPLWIVPYMVYRKNKERKQNARGGAKMSITIQQAIRALHLPGDHIRSYDEYGWGVDDELKEAMQMAKIALREKAEREDPQPLTLEELRQMDGEPVWIDDWWESSHGWELSMDASDYFEGERRTEKEYGSIWVAYRHKPKEVQK